MDGLASTQKHKKKTYNLEKNILEKEIYFRKKLSFIYPCIERAMEASLSFSFVVSRASATMSSLINLIFSLGPTFDASIWVKQIQFGFLWFVCPTVGSQVVCALVQ